MTDLNPFDFSAWESAGDVVESVASDAVAMPRAHIFHSADDDVRNPSLRPPSSPGQEMTPAGEEPSLFSGTALYLVRAGGTLFGSEQIILYAPASCPGANSFEPSTGTFRM